MKEKDLIVELSNRLSIPENQADALLTAFSESIGEYLSANDSVMIQGLGLFEVKKKAERISVNPTNGKRYLVPPKLAPVFKPSTMLKDKFKNLEEHE